MYLAMKYLIILLLEISQIEILISNIQISYLKLKLKVIQ